MGKKVHIDEVRKFIGSTPVFGVRDVDLLVGNRRYARLMLHNMAKKGEIHRITRGWYSSVDDPTLSVFAFAPSYIGLQDALSVRGLWEQETNVVLVTSGKVNPGERVVFGGRVLVHRLAPRYFFGFDQVPYGPYSVPVSDLEKTLVDLVYFYESPGPDVLRRLRRRADVDILERYLARYPQGFVSRFREAVGSSRRPGASTSSALSHEGPRRGS